VASPSEPIHLDLGSAVCKFSAAPVTSQASLQPIYTIQKNAGHSPINWFRAFLYPIAYYALGRKKESDAALSELIAKYHASSPYEIAKVYAFRKQPDEALEWLERAYTQRDSGLIFTKVDPLLKSLHGDPRYTSFLKKLNLPVKRFRNDQMAVQLWLLRALAPI